MKPSKTQHNLLRYLQKLKPILKPYRGWVIVSIISAILLEFINLVTAYLYQSLTDTALNMDLERFYTLVLITVLMLAFDLGITYLSKASLAEYQIPGIRDLKNQVTAHIQRTKLAFTDKLHSGDFVSRINNDISKIENVVKNLPRYFSQPFVFTLGFAYLWAISWKLLVATCFLIPFSALLFDKVMKPVQSLSEQKMQELARLNAASQDAIRGIYIIKAFNLQGILTKKYRQIADSLEEVNVKIDTRDAISLGIFLALRFIPQMVVPLYGGYLTFTGEITLGSLLAANLLIWTLFLPVEDFLRWIKEYREAVPAFDRIYEILEQPQENYSGEALGDFTGHSALSFRSVSFTYNGDQNILDELDFEVHPGEKVALVGSSGCGKSTVLKLCSGFYEPANGQILLFGSDMYETNISQVRENIALVSQDTYLFPTTITENIRYGRLNATQEEVVSAAKAANAHDFILEQPQGYDTLVGEWGAKLSGGQKQRISLARAILKDAPILLLDEPTSALDTQAEVIVQEAIERLMRGRTVLMVAHRLSTIHDVDRILVLDQGKIIETGTHEELLAEETFYKQLYSKQFNSYGEAQLTGEEVSYV